jgi:putative ABC transport system permease protein
MGASVAMLVVAVVGIAVGTFGPVYLNSADQSVLASTLDAQPAGNSGLSILAEEGQTGPAGLRRILQGAPRSGSGAALFGAPIVTADLPISTTSSTDAQFYRADLISRTGVCVHLSFVSGTCPTSDNTVALTNRNAKSLGVRVGEVIHIGAFKGTAPISLRVVGIVRPANPLAPYWWGINYFPFGVSSPSGASRPYDTLDSFFTSQRTMLALARSVPGQVSYLAQSPLLASEMAHTGIPGFESSLRHFESEVHASFGVSASTLVTGILASVVRQEHTMTAIVGVILVQLVLLSLMVLYFVAARSAEARKPDVRLAELRGLPLSRRASIALFEPFVLLVLALPFGIGAAWLAAWLFAPHLFTGHVTTTVTSLALLAALLTCAGGLMATVLGVRGLLVGQGASADSNSAGSGTMALAVDAVAVTLAVAAFVEVAIAGVSSGDRTDPLAAMAPGLLAFGVGVLGARLLPLAARLSAPLTRNSRWVGAALATRRLSRRPEISRHAIVVSVAVGLTIFAVTGWSVANHNRRVRSQFDVGSAQVLTVETRPGVNFEQAVRRADPSGHRAMAAVIENAPDGETLAVDSSRLAAVASWPAGLSSQSVEAISRKLSPPTTRPIVLSGQAVRMAIDLQQPVTPAPDLDLTVFDDAYQTTSTLNLGALHAGSGEYAASLSGACMHTCRVVDVGLTWTPSGSSPEQSVRFPLTITAMSTQSAGGSWAPVRAYLNARRWESSSGGVTFERTSPGLSVKATVDADGATVALTPRDVPAELPAVITGTGNADTGGPDLGVGLDGATLNVKPVASVNALPGVGAGPTMVDLALAERLQSGSMVGTTLQVWLGGDDRAVEQRLRAQGIVIVGERSAAAQEVALSRSAVSLAYDLFQLAALAAVALAVGSTLFSVVVAARRRTGELASLQAVGVPRSPLRRSLLMEHGLVIGLGVVLGCIAGLVSASVALPSIPEFVSEGAGPPLSYAVPLAALGVTVLVVLGSLALSVVVATRVVVATATADKLGGERE